MCNRKRYVVHITDAEKRKADLLYDELGQHFWPIIGTANFSAISTMYDTIDMMEDAGMVRFRVKKLLSKIESVHKKYCNDTRSSICDRFYLWQDVVSRANDKLKPDIMKLYFSIKQNLDRRSVEDSAIVAQVHTAMTMLTISLGIFDATTSVFQEQTVLDITTPYRKGRLTDIDRLWREITGIVTPRMIGGDMKFENDANCKLAVDVIIQKYQTKDFIEKAAVEAMQLNPSMVKYAREEDRHFFEKQ